MRKISPGNLRNEAKLAHVATENSTTCTHSCGAAGYQITSHVSAKPGFPSPRVEITVLLGSSDLGHQGSLFQHRLNSWPIIQRK